MEEKSPTANPVRVGSMEELRRIFQEFDRNGDGKISCGEVKHSLGVMGTPMTAEEVEVMVKDFDKDGDGYIDFDEFVDFIQRGGSDGGEDEGKELKDAFDLYDMDKNGLISATELHAALKKLGMKSTVAECNKMIRQVDEDGDGSVNFHEFKKMMTNGPAYDF